MTGELREYSSGDHVKTWGRPPARWGDDMERITGNWIITAQNFQIWKNIEEVYVQVLHHEDCIHENITYQVMEHKNVSQLCMVSHTRFSWYICIQLKSKNMSKKCGGFSVSDKLFLLKTCTSTRIILVWLSLSAKMSENNINMHYFGTWNMYLFIMQLKHDAFERETKSADTRINFKLPDIRVLEMKHALLEYINHSYWQL